MQAPMPRARGPPNPGSRQEVLSSTASAQHLPSLTHHVYDVNFWVGFQMCMGA